MELYYDMLVPYMPDAVKSESGEMVADDILGAGRQAMVELSEFQTTGNVMALYHAVICACKYAGKDLVETIRNIPEDCKIDDEATISCLLDESAMMLFSSIDKEHYPFSLDKFVANVLTASHIAYMMVRQNVAAQAKEETSEELTSED